MAKTSIPALLMVVLNVAWWCVALALMLTVCFAGVSAFTTLEVAGSGG